MQARAERIKEPFEPQGRRKEPDDRKGYRRDAKHAENRKGEGRSESRFVAPPASRRQARNNARGQETRTRQSARGRWHNLREPSKEPALQRPKIEIGKLKYERPAGSRATQTKSGRPQKSVATKSGNSDQETVEASRARPSARTRSGTRRSSRTRPNQERACRV